MVFGPAKVLLRLGKTHSREIGMNLPEKKSATKYDLTTVPYF